MKKRWKFKVLSIFLVVVMVISGMQSLTTMRSVEATENATYTELTFTDFGLDDGEQSGVENYKDYKEHAITSWNQVEVSGYVTFLTTSASSYLGFGVGGGYVAVRFSPDNGQIMLGGAGISSADGNLYSDADVVVGEPVSLRITFDVSETNLSVSLYVNDAEPVSTTYRISQDAVSGIRVYTKYAEDTIVYESVQKEEEPYTELTFRDWGLSDSSIEDTNVLNNSKTPIASWDRVAISGYVSFDTESAASHIGFKVTASGYVALRYNPSTNQMRLGGAGISTTGGDAYSTAEMTAGEEVYVRLTFDVTGTALTVGMYINEAEPVYATYATNGTAYGMRVSPNASGATVAFRSTEETEDEETYTELTFSSWGLSNGSVENTNILNNSKTPITSWDKVSISGYVAFDTESAASHIGFKVTSSGYVALRYNPSTNQMRLGGAGISVNGGDVYSSAEITAGEEIYVRLTFDVAGSNLTVGMYINEAEPVYATYATGGTSYGMRIAPNVEGAMITFKSTGSDFPENPDNPNPPALPENPNSPETPGVSDTPQKALSEYEIITFSDVGIGDQTVEGRTVNCNGSMQTLDGKVFKGMITFPTESEGEMDGILTVGGMASNKWLGLRIGVTNTGAMYIRDASNGANRWTISQDKMNVGSDVRGQQIELGLTFTCIDSQTVYVGLYVNGTFCGEKLFENLIKEFGATVMVYSARAQVSIASIVNGFSDTAQKAFSEYKMLTFSDFGIKDQTVEARTINCNSAVSDLNGKLFQGKIMFTTESTGNDGILTIGGNTSNRWLGIRVGVMNNGQLYICEGANPAQRWNISPKTFGISDVRGKEIELGMTFTYTDKNNVYVGVYINGTFCGEKLFKNLVSELGSTLMVYSKTNPIQIAASETPWTKFLKSAVNLAYFGFTENWEQELEAICK